MSERGFGSCYDDAAAQLANKNVLSNIQGQDQDNEININIDIDADGDDSGGSGDKVTICHEGQTLEVAPQALPAHYGHGDTLGPCEEVTTNPKNAPKAEPATESVIDDSPEADPVSDPVSPIEPVTESTEGPEAEPIEDSTIELESG